MCDIRVCCNFLGIIFLLFFLGKVTTVCLGQVASKVDASQKAWGSWGFWSAWAGVCVGGG